MNMKQTMILSSLLMVLLLNIFKWLPKMGEQILGEKQSKKVIGTLILEAI